MVKVAVVGASGYAGAQLVKMISAHSKLELTNLFVSEKSLDLGKKISELYGFLDGICDKTLQPLTSPKDIIACADAVFLATDHKVSHDIAPELVKAGVVVFDLSGAFRISDTDVFAKAYGFEHEHIGKGVSTILSNFTNTHNINVDLVLFDENSKKYY